MSTVLLVGFTPRNGFTDDLRLRGLTVHEFSTPEEAMTHLEGAIPDVVVTDQVFGGSSTDDRSFIRSLRRRLNDHAVSVIVVSAHRRQGDRDAIRDAGADMFLQKPTLPVELGDEVERALTLRREGKRLSWNWQPEAPPDVDSDRRRRKP